MGRPYLTSYKKSSSEREIENLNTYGLISKMELCKKDSTRLKIGKIKNWQSQTLASFNELLLKNKTNIRMLKINYKNQSAQGKFVVHVY